MKKILLVLLLITSALTMVACDGYEEGYYAHGGKYKVVGQSAEFDILKDTETGCLYLESVYSADVQVPYYGKDGKIQGCGEEME